MQELNIHSEARAKLAAKLKDKPKIFPLDSDPLLASLVACMGIHKELGHPNLDRLSAPLGVDLEKTPHTWDSSIVSHEGQIGITFWRKKGQPLRPLEKDFAHILNQNSFDQSGELSKAVIFPVQVFNNYKKKGIELVIVRDWALSAIFAKENVNYLNSNSWEILNKTAYDQAELMFSRQIAFSGTHDIADHLLGADAQRFSEPQPLFKRVRTLFREIPVHQNSSHLMIAYAIGVLLDDLAQPKWYGSPVHLKILRYFLEVFENQSSVTLTDFTLPNSFHILFAAIRENTKASINATNWLAPEFVRVVTTNNPSHAPGDETRRPSVSSPVWRG